MEIGGETFAGATGETPLGFGHWLISEKEKIAAISARHRDLNDDLGQSEVEFSITMKDGKTETRHVQLGEGKVAEVVRIWVRELEKDSGLTISLEG